MSVEVMAEKAANYIGEEYRDDDFESVCYLSLIHIYNSLEDKIDIVTGDIKEAAEQFGPASFDVITTNPPYMIGEHGLKNEKEALYIARHEAPVSYTHLDVYKRQIFDCRRDAGSSRCLFENE